MGVRFAKSWCLSGWADRERHTKWHSDGFLTALFSPWPHFVARNCAFIYLFTSFPDAVNSIHFFVNGQVTLHHEQGQPQCDIWWLRGLVDDASEIKVSFYFLYKGRWGKWTVILLKGILHYVCGVQMSLTLRCSWIACFFFSHIIRPILWPRMKYLKRYLVDCH